MITCELVQSVILLLIALSLPPLPLLLVLVAARAIGGQVFQAASRAAVPPWSPTATWSRPSRRSGSARTVRRRSDR